MNCQRPGCHREAKPGDIFCSTSCVIQGRSGKGTISVISESPKNTLTFEELLDTLNSIPEEVQQ